MRKPRKSLAVTQRPSGCGAKTTPSPPPAAHQPARALMFHSPKDRNLLPYLKHQQPQRLYSLSVSLAKSNSPFSPLSTLLCVRDPRGRRLTPAFPASVPLPQLCPGTVRPCPSTCTAHRRRRQNTRHSFTLPALPTPYTIPPIATVHRAPPAKTLSGLSSQGRR